MLETVAPVFQRYDEKPEVAVNNVTPPFIVSCNWERSVVELEEAVGGEDGLGFVVLFEYTNDLGPVAADTEKVRHVAVQLVLVEFSSIATTRLLPVH